MRLLERLPNDDGETVTIVPVTCLRDFRLSLNISGPWVLVDYSEFGWDWNQESSYRWGTGERLNSERFQNDDWWMLESFIQKNPPILIFQRELLAKDVSETLLPIEYLNYSPKATPDDAETFARRPIDVVFSWGLSHRARQRVHGDIFRDSQKHGYTVVSQWNHIDSQIRDNNQGGIWCAIHTPHFCRIGGDEMTAWFNKSKIVVAMSGDGVKTFRHGEIPNSIIVTPKDALAWHVPVNSLQMNPGEEVSTIAALLKAPELHEVYRKMVTISDALRQERYISEYMIPAIKARL